MMELNSLAVLSIVSFFFVIYLSIIKYAFMKYSVKGCSKGYPTNIFDYDVKEKKASPTTLQQVVTCQPTLTTYSTNSPYCTEHRLLSLRKHFENVRRHRISRRKAREDYVRALEVKAQNFEKLYADTQRDIKILREKLTLLEGRLIKAQKIHNINNASYLNQVEGRNNDDSFSNVVISNGLSASNNHGEENNDAIV
ncbi:hypothetical protein C1646_707744 [Rhizophagus diaphanus]|nr:hypothetical protein C1646_707744 [Rhizophagus diaphanus] [Rhizophagus sp. MUCL 43196]